MGQLVWRLGGQNVKDLQHNFGIPGSSLSESRHTADRSRPGRVHHGVSGRRGGFGHGRGGAALR